MVENGSTEEDGNKSLDCKVLTNDERLHIRDIARLARYKESEQERIEAENGVSEGNEPKSLDTKALTHTDRIAALEEVFRDHENWLIRLDKHKTVFRLEQRIKAVVGQIETLEGRTFGEGTDVIKGITKDLKELQQSVYAIHPKVATLELAIRAIDQQIGELVKKGQRKVDFSRDIQALKAAFGAFGKHVHLPDGQIGLPLKLNLT